MIPSYRRLCDQLTACSAAETFCLMRENILPLVCAVTSSSSHAETKQNGARRYSYYLCHTDVAYHISEINVKNLSCERRVARRTGVLQYFNRHEKKLFRSLDDVQKAGMRRADDRLRLDSERADF